MRPMGPQGLSYFTFNSCQAAPLSKPLDFCQPPRRSLIFQLTLVLPATDTVSTASHPMVLQCGSYATMSPANRVALCKYAIFFLKFVMCISLSAKYSQLKLIIIKSDIIFSSKTTMASSSAGAESEEVVQPPWKLDESL